MPTCKCGFNDGPNVEGWQLLATFGPTLYVDIGFDPDYDGTVPLTQRVPIPGLEGVAALIDTGATESCIDNQLAIDLHLPVIDQRLIGGVGGVHTVNMYLAQIRVKLLRVTLNGVFAGVHLQAGGQQHRALIGRIFLRNFTLTYEGMTGTVTLAKPD